ncbi:MAG: cytochrome c, partial [Spirochaetales bacterium]|nr:cytochrome c [Spirochaetales bacterium]
AFLLAGVFAFLTCAFQKDPVLRRTMTIFSGKWAIISLVGVALSGAWYVAVLPEPAKALVLGKSPTITTFVKLGSYGLMALLLLTFILTVIKPSLNKKPVALLVFLAAFMVMGSFEWIREAARRPYVVNEVLYTNSIYKKDVERLNQQGFLSEAKWKVHKDITSDNQLEVGKDLFILQCYSCHTVDGINNPLKPKTKAMSYAGMIHYLQKTILNRPFMPPFIGTEEEAKALAAYLTNGLHGTELTLPTSGGSPLQQGAQLFKIHCGSCHDAAEMTDMISDWDMESATKNLGRLSTLSDEMENFTGSATQTASLALYIFSLNNTIEAAKSSLNGQDIFATHCGSCHDMQDLSEIAKAMGRNAFRTALDHLPDLVADMPPFEGTTAEKDELATTLTTSQGGAQ